MSTGHTLTWFVFASNKIDSDNFFYILGERTRHKAYKINRVLVIHVSVRLSARASDSKHMAAVSSTTH